MKRDEIDIEISRMLKQSLPEAGHDKWFTRKVLNRLPDKQKHSRGWIEPCLYFTGLLVCFIGWGLFLCSLSPNMILVKDIVSFGILTVTTFLLIWNIVENVFVGDI